MSMIRCNFINSVQTFSSLLGGLGVYSATCQDLFSISLISSKELEISKFDDVK